MSNLYCFLDESFSERVFCLGGILVNENDMSHIQQDWIEFKEVIGLNRSDFIKWSLGSEGEEKIIKDKIKLSLRDERDWLKSFHMKTLDKISSFELMLVASIHQDVRLIQRIIGDKKISPVDFYIWAFKFVIQRIWQNVKDDDTLSCFIFIDKPPESRRLKGTDKQICESFKETYYKGFNFENSNIPPLKNCGFFECPFIGKSNYSSFIQISDFCVGAIRERAKDLLKDKINNPSKDYIKLLKSKFYKTDTEDIVGFGLVVFPRERELYGLIKEDFIRIDNEFEEEILPF